MKKFWFLHIVLTIFIFGQNNYPIVLIHGFMGWGPGEMGTIIIGVGRKTLYHI